MTLNTSQSVCTKIFIGVAIHAELRIQLNQSHAWKQSRVTAGQDPLEPIEVRFHQKDYLGFQTEGSICPWPLLQKNQQLTKQALLRYCPQLNSDALNVHLFPQNFIA